MTRHAAQQPPRASAPHASILGRVSPFARQALGFFIAGVALFLLAWNGNPSAWPLLAFLIVLAVVWLGASVIARVLSPWANKRKDLRAVFGLPLSQWAMLFLAVFGVLYLLSPSPAFALGAFAGLAYLILNELIPHTLTESGIRVSLSELAWALGLASLAWVCLTVVLATNSPLDVVTSCSMTPALQRGDFIVLSGRGVTARSSVQTSLRLEDFLGQSRVRNTVCTQTFSDGRARNVTCQQLLLPPGGTDLSLHPGEPGDVVVYEPNPPVAGTDLIIHRALVQVNASDGTFYLTKGDNNALVDQATGLNAPSLKSIHGKMLFRIPLIGYLKLLLFLQFDTPGNCQYQLAVPAIQ